jgi:molybdate transport system ATP-binding protein
VEIKLGATIILVEQQHHFRNLSNTSSFYYQQRFNSSDADDALQVKDYFQDDHLSPTANDIFSLLGVHHLWSKHLSQLSNGENKRIQLAKALIQEPDILLLDNPYLGLDVEARKILNGILSSIADKGISIIIATNSQFIPDSINYVLELKGEKEGNFIPREIFVQRHCFEPASIVLDKSLLELLTKDEEDTFQFAVKMKNVSVRYSENLILHEINWEVKKGDHWSLSGANGAGKSTLLSLINADNPQAYANEIYLFDRRRGRGESIWDIKKKIGYVSPELHLFFESSTTAFGSVASGLFDTIGLFRPLNEEQKATVKAWMRLLHIENLEHKLLTNLSLGNQRLVLLARALVKNPPLLLLDEPAQGLDEEQAALFKSIMEQICAHSSKTLIYVTHLKEEVPSCVDKFIVLKAGRIAKE